MKPNTKEINLFKDNEGMEIIKIAGEGILAAGAIAITGIAFGAANKVLGVNNSGGKF